MKNYKQIITERLILEPFSEKYLSEEYVSWLNDPELMKFSENRHRKHSLESCRAYLQSFDNSPNFFWAVLLKENSEHIGNVNAYINEPNSIADIGILIGKKRYHGQGYASEAWNAVINFLLKNCELRKVTAGTMAGNKPMLKIMHNSGMIEDGIRKRHYLLDGREVDIIHMAKFTKN